jgi:hypothetical protein
MKRRDEGRSGLLDGKGSRRREEGTRSELSVRQVQVITLYEVGVTCYVKSLKRLKSSRNM